MLLADPRLAEPIEPARRRPGQGGGRRGPAADPGRRARRRSRRCRRCWPAAGSARPSLQPVLNATGVVLHTNLGRAPLSAAAVDGGRGRGRLPRRRVRPGRPAARARRGRGALAALAEAVPDGRGRAGGQQRRGRAAAGHHRAGRRPRGDGQPGRAGRDRRRVPAAGADRVRPAPGSARSAPPTAPRWPTTPRRSGRTPAAC